jgi:hypothetical protein
VGKAESITEIISKKQKKKSLVTEIRVVKAPALKPQDNYIMLV